MGGNALKNTELKRYSKENYNQIAKHVSNVLKKLNIVCEPTISYENKPDFGDLDMLIKSSTIKTDLRTLIEEYFAPNEIYHNGNAWSFDFNKFQIDFILVSDENWETTKIYFSYNDLGNFMGRIAYSMGFRYGDYGLKANYYIDGKKFTGMVSQEPEMIFEFLGFNWETYKNGFHGLDDIFNFIVESKYFNSKIFNYDELNHQNKTRNKKRKNYQLFLEHVTKLNQPFKYEYKSQDEYLIDADNFFDTNLIEEIDNWKKIIERELYAHENFNGNIIMELFDLKGKELGNSIKTFKSVIRDEYYPEVMDDNAIKANFNDWIIGNDQETIWNEFARINNVIIKI